MYKNLTAYVFNRINPETAKNLMTLMSSSFVASLIPIFLAPVYSRLYSPENYGLFGILIALSSLLGILAYSHVPQTIMLAKTNSDAFENFQLSLFVNLAVCSVVFVFLVIAFATASAFNTTWSFNSVFLLVPLITFLNGLTQSISVWLNRNKHYKQLSINRILQVVVSAISQLILGIYYHNHYGIIISYIAGCVAALLYLYYQVSEIRVWIQVKKGLVRKFLPGIQGITSIFNACRADQ
jgi:lipopolysaccharide exporter